LNLAYIADHMTKPGSLVIIGRRPVLEALEAGMPIDKVLVDPPFQMPELTGICKRLGIPLQRVPKEKLDSYGANHQGIAALVSQVEYAQLDQVLSNLSDEGKVPLLVILDRITDVGNFGAIARSAEVLGAHALVFPARESAQLNADAIKRSAGALLRLPLCRVPDLQSAVKLLQESGIILVVADEKAELLVADVPFDQPCAIIMGSEGEGVHPALRTAADYAMRIPQAGSLDSLNVSVAAGIILYEAMRRRSMAGDAGTR
jgi:23S rRNA (guanosine2251-2'-O)-methyltransferase